MKKLIFITSLIFSLIILISCVDKNVVKASELNAVSQVTNGPLKCKTLQIVKFYYPNINEANLYFVNKQLFFNTKDIAKNIFEKAFKELPKGDLGKVLSPNVKIRSLYLNKDNIVYVDFTKEFVSEMNAGSGYEDMILQSVTNTLGTYYGVDKVYITIEGSTYVSGHIMQKAGEFFIVDLKNSIELK